MVDAVAPVAPEGDLQQLAARRDRLRPRRSELALARRAEEAEAAAYPVVINVIAGIRRSRDTSSSPRMARHRATLEELMADVEELQGLIARVTRIVRNLELDADDPERHRAERATHGGLVAFARLSEDFRRITDGEDVGDGAR